jgi:hypothetical protein
MCGNFIFRLYYSAHQAFRQENKPLLSLIRCLGERVFSRFRIIRNTALTCRASGETVVVEACTNLANAAWQPLQTNTLTTGTASFSDPQWINYPARFYRLRSP